MITFKRVHFLLWACLGLSACTPEETHIDKDLAPSKRQAPELNGNPMRPLLIRGTVSISLGLRLVAIYTTDGSDKCRVSSSFLSGVLEGASGPSQLSVPLNIMRSGRAFSASVFVDRFKPGHCGWQLDYVDAYVSKGGLQSISNLIIRTHRGRGSVTTESEYENSSSYPVVLRCSFKGLEALGPGEMSNACSSHPSPPYKYQHYLTGKDEEVVVHILDQNFRP